MEMEIKIEECKLNLKSAIKLRHKTIQQESEDEYIPLSSIKQLKTLRQKKGKPSHKLKVFTCRICYIEFETRKKLYDHNKTHELEEKHEEKLTLKLDEDLTTDICKFCLQKFKKKRDLSEHLKTHIISETEDLNYEYDPEQEVYTCNQCSAEFQDEKRAQKHLETHLDRYQCKNCKEFVVGAYNYSIHAQQHRKDKFYSCPKCSYVTPKKTSIWTHIKTLHFHKYDFQCPKCGKCFNDALLFKEHDNLHLGLKPFVCIVCSKEFMYTRYLASHQMRTHTVRVQDQNSKTQCCHCNKIFAKSESLVKHLVTHHKPQKLVIPPKKHLCDVCGQGFSRTDKLKIHYRKHTGDKPYACSYCGKSFIKRDYLVMHERIHSGEKPYKCEFCGKCFNQGAPLRIHMRGHTGERPYVCPYCTIGCISKGALNAHVKNCVGML